MAIDEINEMKNLMEQMEALRASMQAKEYDVEARTKVEELRQVISGIDDQMKMLREERKNVLDEMRPYEDILKAMGKPRMISTPTGARCTLKDPETGKEYASYADAARKEGIYVPGASQHAIWMREKGYDLEQVCKPE